MAKKKSMKGVICYGVSGILSALMFVWLCITGISTTYTVVGQSSTSSSTGWDMLGTDLDDGTFTTGKVFTIIMLVLAGLAFVWCIFGLLCSFGTIKFKYTKVVSLILGMLLFVVALVAFILMAIYCGNAGGNFYGFASGETALGFAYYAELASALLVALGMMFASKNN